MEEKLVMYEEKMLKTIDNLESEFAGIRAGRANPHILNKITIDYYGTETPLQQVGNISVPEPKVILISPWDAKLIKDIEKAIQASDIGIHPTNDGQNIRLVFPDLTEERRKELAKDVKKKSEEAKVAIRNIRRDGIDVFRKLAKSGEVSEDSGKDLENEIQKLTDKYVGEIDKLTVAKTEEIMTV
ncbi:MAG: ribosome recycling factor [Lachnospiraceae bacterium]|jgi:ribosome recycling factor